jgi:ribosomal-protein-alanine N-acetyltransferase
MKEILLEHNGSIFRRCTPSDLIAVKEINMKTLPDHHSDYVYEVLLAECSEAFLVAEKDDQIMGYVMCGTDFGYSNFKKPGIMKKGHIVSLSLLEEHRGKGIGKILVAEAHKGLKEKQCDETYLEVRCSNTVAINLYQGFGMEIKQRLKSYYRDGEDAYRMIIKY